MVAVLPCTISKPIRQRVLLTQGTLERVFNYVLELHETNIESALADEKDYLRRRKPVLKVTYRDGTKYEVHDLETLRAIVPGKGKSIKSIEISSPLGDLSCSVNLETYQNIQCVNVVVKGPEDKASHFAEAVISELKRDTDITVFARRLWPAAWGLGFAVAIILPFAISNVATSKDFVALLMVLAFATLFLTIPVELFRAKWLPPVAFMWGEDGKRAAQARKVVTALVVSLPLWFLGNAASRLLFE